MVFFTEVYEDGILQKIEAVYLITKTEVQRKEKAAETEKIPIPEVSRCFVLVFEVINWLPRINDLIDYFFDTVYQPGDYLIITTPVKSYNLSERALKQMPKDRIGSQLKSLLRKDIIEGNMGYKSLMRDIISFEGLTGRISLMLWKMFQIFLSTFKGRSISFSSIKKRRFPCLQKWRN